MMIHDGLVSIFFLGSGPKNCVFEGQDYRTSRENHLERFEEILGVERILWGTDIVDSVPYVQVGYFRAENYLGEPLLSQEQLSGCALSVMSFPHWQLNNLLSFPLHLGAICPGLPETSVLLPFPR